jgi:hypothetical protein
VYPNTADPHDSPAILLEPIGGKPVATVVGSLSELGQIKPGMELIEVDGRAVADVIEHDIDPYIFSSTPQDREINEMSSVLQGPPGSIARTKWLTLDGLTVQVAIPRNSSQHRAALKIPNRPRFDCRELAGGIAYLGLNTFNDPAIDSDFEAKFNELRRAKSWIIDLRYNGGGSSGIGYAILAHFIDAPVEGSRQSTRLYNPTLAARNQGATLVRLGNRYGRACRGAALSWARLCAHQPLDMQRGRRLPNPCPGSQASHHRRRAVLRLDWATPRIFDIRRNCPRLHEVGPFSRRNRICRGWSRPRY